MSSGFNLILIFHCTALLLYCADQKEYAVSRIPAELLNKSGAVVRINDYHLEIKNKTSAVLKIKKAITLFKESGESYNEFSHYSNKFVAIKDIEGSIYDADGELVKELESKDIKERSAVSSSSLYEDTRIKSAELYHHVYPYTVEFEYEIKYKGFLGFPAWYSRTTVDPVEKRVLTIEAYENNIRYWCNQDSSVKPLITRDGDKVTYVWTAEHLPKLAENATEDYIEDMVTVVYIAPTEFQIDDYPGRMDSWKAFGTWYNSLISGRDRLPDDAVNDVHKLTDTIRDPLKKVSELYKYLQSRTRYVSIQLGIGGWQPYDADFVHSRGYGDCKALTNYMMSLLKEAGIISFPVLINAGSPRYPMITEFPNNQFNHVILSVPLSSDTIWLECTSRTAYSGFLGHFTENRNALMVTPEGGVVVKTPGSIAEENLQVRTLSVLLNSDGSANIQSKMFWCGDQNNYVQNLLEFRSPEEQQNWVLDLLESSDCKITLLRFSSTEARRTDLDFDYSISAYCNVSNNRIFFNPNLMEKKTSIPAQMTKRISPVLFSYPYRDVDTVFFNLPQGYKIEALPSPAEYYFPAGKYQVKIDRLSDGRLRYVRLFEISRYRLEAKEYKSYREFYSNIVKWERGTVVLIKETTPGG